MSSTSSYFFNYDKSLPELAAEINLSLGCSLSPYEGDGEDLFARFLSMEFSLQAATGYENDGDLDFENFAYNIDFRVPWPNAAARPLQLPAMAVVIYALHHRMGITGLLVNEMSTLLARYEEREIASYGRRLFDVVSATPFIDFSAHLSLLESRLTRRRK
jgi:hypothetical protein